MIIASMCFGMMGFFIKLSYAQNPNLEGGDVLLFRSCLMLPFYYIYAKSLGVNLFDISFYHAMILTLRCITGACAMTFIFMSIKILPTTITFMLFNMNPLLVSIFAYFLLKEKLTLTSALCTAAAFGGIV